MAACYNLLAFAAQAVAHLIKNSGKNVLIVIYVLAGLSILLAIGGLTTNHPVVVLASIVSIIFAVLAVALEEWWPLVNGLAVNWGLRLLGFDPRSRK